MSKARCILTIVGLVIMLSPTTFAQEYICGDANDDGIINIGDFTIYYNYLFDKNDDPINLDAADVDSIRGITLHDAAFFVYSYFGAGPDPYCLPFPDSTLQVTDDILEIRNTLVPAGATIVKIDLHITSSTGEKIYGASFPFSYSCATSNSMILPFPKMDYLLPTPLLVTIFMPVKIRGW